MPVNRKSLFWGMLLFLVLLPKMGVAYDNNILAPGRPWHLDSGLDSITCVGCTGGTSTVNQGTPNASVAQAWPFKLTDGVHLLSIGADGSLPVSPQGKTSVFHVRNVYASVNVTTSAYVQLVASTSSVITELYLFDSSGQTLVLATGGAGVEVDQLFIVPGGDDLVHLGIPGGTRVSIKAVSATANRGEIDVNAFN